MDQDQGDYHNESPFNLLTLPTELLVYIISFLSSLHDRVKLRHVSRWFKCVIEEAPSLWKELTWPYYESRQECSVKEVLKVCGQHIKVLSFPYSRVPSTLVEMLQYCSNVQHLSLPSTKLEPEQLQRMMQHMRYLKTLEVKVDNDSHIKQLFSDTGHLQEITIVSYSKSHVFYVDVFRYWQENQFRPPNFNVITSPHNVFECLLNHVSELDSIPTGTTACFRLFDGHDKLPFFQLQVEPSGQMTTPCMKLSDYGIQGVEGDLAVMTDCQYGANRLYGVVSYFDSIANLIAIAKPFNLNCATYLDFSSQSSLHSEHLEQLAIACPNLQRLFLKSSYYCLRSLKGLRAIASHCHNLQGLNLLGICVGEVEDLTGLWEILSNMKLTHLAAQCCTFRSEAVAKGMLLKMCLSIRAVEFKRCFCCSYEELDTSMLSYFTSLHYCYLIDLKFLSLDMIETCKELLCVGVFGLNLTHAKNLKQLYICASTTDISNEFMISISAHGGLVRVFMQVRSLTAEGVTFLVRNSPKLIALYLRTEFNLNEEHFKATLKKEFSKRRLFTTGYCNVNDKGGFPPDDTLREQGVDFPLSFWN